MSQDSFKSNSDSYFSSSDYKPSAYTDFSSQSSRSYNHDNDNYYKKFDDYSSFSSDNTNIKQAPSSYSNFNPQDYQYTSNNDSSFDNKTNFNQNYSDNFVRDNQNTLENTNYSINKPNIENLQNNKMQVPPKKPVQKITVRDVLQLPLQRQQYLKTLSLENLRTQPEYTVLLKRPPVVLSILDYYEKIIPDKEFNSQVRTLKKGKQIKEVVWLASILGYLLLTGKLRPPGSQFKGVFKGRYHFMIPVVFTGLMFYDNHNTRKKSKQLVNDPRNFNNIDLAVRKFICETKYKQRVTVFGQA